MRTDANYINPDEIFPSDLKVRYHDARLIGKGGMGRVFKAHDSRLIKDVAIKLLPASNEKNSAILRFQQEAKAVSKLNNPHIVKVQDFGFSEEEREPFLVMEFIEGIDLDSIIKSSGPMPFSRAIEIAMEACEGLSHAHNNGILHRDLKPSNIMIDANNRVRILDFGLAKVLKQSQDDTEQALTKPGRLMGSVLFISPEQFEGKEATELSEIYSLALVLFNMVTGTLPNEGDNLMKFMRKRREDAPPAIPDSFSDPLRRELNEILQKALAVDPSQRYDSIDAFRNALEQCLHKGSEKPDEQTVAKQKERSHHIKAVASIFALVIVAIASTTYLNSKNKEQPTKPLKKAVVLKQHDPDLPPGFARDTERKIIWWRADDNVTDDHLEPLIGSDVKSLNLQGNQEITDQGLHKIRMLKLDALNVRDSLISDKSVDDINNFKLKGLNIRSSKITEDGILRLTPNPALQDLDLKYIALTDRGLHHVVSVFPNLRNINVGYTKVNKNGEHFRILKRLKKLKLFFGESIDITDPDVDTLVTMQPTSLELAGNPITHRSIEKLLTLPHVEYLSLAGCKGIPDEDLVALQRRFPRADITAPVHAKDAVPDDAMEMFMEVGGK